MHESDGGTLCTTLELDGTAPRIQLAGVVTGRMLVEVYCNGAQVSEDLVTNENLDAIVDLAPFATLPRVEVAVHFIPATHGTIRIAREVTLLSKSAPLSGHIPTMSDADRGTLSLQSGQLG